MYDAQSEKVVSEKSTVSRAAKSPRSLHAHPNTNTGTMSRAHDTASIANPTSPSHRQTVDTANSRNIAGDSKELIEMNEVVMSDAASPESPQHAKHSI